MGVLIGTMTKKPGLTNASLALALFNVVNGMIVGELQSFLPSTSGAPAVDTSNVDTKKVGMKDYLSMPSLNEYVSGMGAGVISSYSTYKDSLQEQLNKIYLK